jgi:hypothetical protein
MWPVCKTQGCGDENSYNAKGYGGSSIPRSVHRFRIVIDGVYIINFNLNAHACLACCALTIIYGGIKMSNLCVCYYEIVDPDECQYTNKSFNDALNGDNLISFNKAASDIENKCLRLSKEYATLLISHIHKNRLPLLMIRVIPKYIDPFKAEDEGGDPHVIR